MAKKIIKKKHRKDGTSGYSDLPVARENEVETKRTGVFTLGCVPLSTQFKLQFVIS